MSEMHIIRLSHQLNEVMLRFFTEEELVEILIKCVQSKVMIPRFELISTIDVLCEYIIEKHKTNNEFKQKINNVQRQASTWILSDENKNFAKLWLSEEDPEVPEKIQEMLRDVFDLDLAELVEKYVGEKKMDEFTEEIDKKQKKYLTKWIRGNTQRETEKEQIDSGQRHLEELEAIEKLKATAEHDKKFVGGKSFKERQREQEEMTKPQPKITKQMEKLQKLSKITNLKYTDSIQEIKLKDKERFRKIFYVFEKEIHSLSEETKNMIIALWYGNLYTKDDTSSDDILNIVRRYSLQFKIPNDHINSEVNRLILQTYIIGLYTGISVLKIYTVINSVLESNPTMSAHMIMPSMIHDNGNVPNLKIQDVLNPIIKNLPLNEQQLIIRTNWDKLRYPNIDISELVDYINEIRMDLSLRFKILRSIEDLSDNIIKKGLTVEKFAREVYQILKNQTMKIPITEKGIIELLKYET
jgi:hypothetical protein